ncbi:CD225/dispanin family protein [Antribacter gilvus]|uniref:CD225/dispanin family protein n=1 Tax=Antribacter gilvus TaxID=2304675 RepID=UPI000F77D3A5|nr:CD225/dispanin family protein [Antribacter gilvus]
MSTAVPQPAGSPFVTYVPVAMAPPRSHLGLALLALVLFAPAGMLAVVHAGQVRRRWRAGDVAGARAAAARARLWSAVAVLVALAAAAVALALAAAGSAGVAV